MSLNSSCKHVSTRDFEAYVSASSAAERMMILRSWRRDGLGIDATIIQGLMHLPLTSEEIIACFEICSSSQPAQMELWVMKNLLLWDQNIAGAALHAWAKNTNRILWHRLLPILSIPDLPQRIRYTILDIGQFTHGYEITRATLKSPGWEDLSSAFHGILIERALNYDLTSERLNKLAWRILDQNAKVHHPEDKSLIAAIGWLYRHASKSLLKWSEANEGVLWTQLLDAGLESHLSRAAKFSKFERGIAKDREIMSSFGDLLPVWSRDVVSVEAFKALIENPRSGNLSLDGFPHSVVLNHESQIHESWVDHLIAHVPLQDSVKLGVNGSSNFAKSYDVTRFPLLASARSLSVDGKAGLASDVVGQVGEFSDEHNLAETLFHPIEHLFKAFKGPVDNSEFPDSPWATLARGLQKPSLGSLQDVSAVTRKHKGLMVLAHITLLSKMTGSDEAVLKLLDHIRSPDEGELRAVAKALGKINTPRSLLELIGMLTRPNATTTVQQDIVAALQGKDLRGLQKELRSAVHDIKLPPNTDHPLYQIKDELSGMLLPTTGEPIVDEKVSEMRTGRAGGDNDLDGELAGMIPHYADLSSEVKRALRTARFFNNTIKSSPHAHAIDLSPLIDMQYKAMELLYRELFEDAVSQSLQRGVIQRKLDVIGYARPIVKNMDEFESYIAGLPVVKDIPFFSKFKLRKMLRAICQFEPGKRFTLDGLKAFGLYFLVFGRQSCQHGLAGVFQVGTKDDGELAEFCKELHVFQDFRNRAAHEGFHPDASNDVLGIWRTTASCVQWAFKAKQAQNGTANAAQRRAS